MVTFKHGWLLGVVLMLCGGCSHFGVAKRGLSELRGASGKIVPVREAPPAFYGSVGKLQIASVSNTIGPVCPPGMLTRVQAALKREATEAGEKLTGKETCTAEVDITYHQPPAGVKAVLGKEAILLGRARLYDAQGEMRADLLVSVFSEALRTTEEGMADAFGKALVEHVRKGGE